LSFDSAAFNQALGDANQADKLKHVEHIPEGANPMIARATRTRQILENPRKNRVTACRKRLRDNRSVHRSRRQEPSLPDEHTAAMAQFPADSLPVRQLLTLELSHAFDDRPEESVVQEVGIT